MMRTGDRIGGYELLEKLGEGGMAEVWKARNIALERVVAIKFLLERFINDPDLQQRFLQEGRLQARLQHPQIVGILHAGEENGRAFLVTDYVQGKSLEELLESHGGKPLPVEEVLSISYDVLAALEYAHNLPQGAIVHRDVKPSNILLDGRGRARLADFGIAVALNEDRKTKTGFALGSVFYMSPEQIQTPRAIDWRSDIYSFGCVLYEMLTGRPPFGGETDSDFTIKQAHVQTPPEPMRKWNPQVPFEFEWIVFRALSKDRERRFSSAAEMADALRPIVPGRREKRTPTVLELPEEVQTKESQAPIQRVVEEKKVEEVKRAEPVSREIRMGDAGKKDSPLWGQCFWPDFETARSGRLAINIAAGTMAVTGLGLEGWGFLGSGLGKSEHDFFAIAGVAAVLLAVGVWRGWKIAIIIATLPALYLAVGGTLVLLSGKDANEQGTNFLLTLLGVVLSVVLIRALKATFGPRREGTVKQVSAAPVSVESRVESRREDAATDPRPAWKRLLWPRFADVESADHAIQVAALVVLVSSLFVAGWALFGDVSGGKRWMPLLAALVCGLFAVGIWRHWKPAIIAAMAVASLAVLSSVLSFLSELSYSGSYSLSYNGEALRLVLLSGICPLLLIVIAVFTLTLRDERTFGRKIPVLVSGIAVLNLWGIFYIGFRPWEAPLILAGLYCLVAVAAALQWKFAPYAGIALSALAAVFFYSQAEGVYARYSDILSAAVLIVLIVVPALTRALSAVTVYPK